MPEEIIEDLAVSKAANEKLARRINRYWADYKLRANARAVPLYWPNGRKSESHYTIKSDTINATPWST